MSFNDTATAFVKGNDHRIHFWYMTKGDATKLLRNTDLNEKVEYYKTQKYFVICKTWVKKLQRLVILKLKNINFSAIKFLLF